jgi:hypothetical protein
MMINDDEDSEGKIIFQVCTAAAHYPQRVKREG